MARLLCARCPKNAPATVRRARDKLEKMADAAQTALSDRRRKDNQLSEEDSRLLDQLMDTLWGGMRSVLEGIASLPHDSCPRGARADRLRIRMFGTTGSSFLKENYASQHASMKAILQQIKEDKLDKEINALCGPEFLQQIDLLMPRYQRMVDAMMSRDSEPTTNLLTQRNTLARAVVAYATAICSTVDEDDQDSVQEARLALAPIEGQRNAAASRRSPGEPETAPTPGSTDTPDAPEATKDPKSA